MKILKVILSICMLINFSVVSAQDNVKVLVSNSNNGSMIIKWYSENIYFDQPIYVFRQDEGKNAWVLISQKPIVKGIAIPDNVVEKDKVLDLLQNKVLVNKASELDGMTKLILMIKSVQYPDLSEFLGIQFIDSGVSRGNKYRYMISYSNDETQKQIGLSDWIVATEYIPAEAPKDIKTTQEGNSLHFSWKPDEDKFIGVYIYRAIKGQEMVKITSVPVLAGVDENDNYTDYFYTDDSLVTGNEYIYTLKSIDYFGRESNESPKISVTIKDMEPPVAPDKLVCNTEGKIVSIYWENENVPDLAGYKIYRTIANDTVFTCITPNILLKEKNIYIDTLSDIGVYNYRVAAIDDSGNEALSEIYPVEINDVFPPSTPQSLVAVADVGKIVLSWQACKDDDIMGYCVYRSIGPESAFLLLNSEPIKTTTLTDNLPVNAKNEFVYKVVAVDLAYNRSDYSELALSRMPDVSAPEKPIIKTIKQDKNALVIEWYSNSETDLKGYYIYRYDDKSGFEQAQRINNKIK
ncbi:MAG: hypothetical protein JXR36_10125 [Bacteroidales bacterium]|nr:hypothetical protein [Bacteroidales bacterium]